jgi:hypothetical protein
MAELFAAVVAGVPARIINAVVQAIRDRYPDQAVVRGAGARTYDNRLAAYTESYLNEVLDEAADAIFGKSERPNGFCRNSQRACADRSEGQAKLCSKAQASTCSRAKPDRFFLIYQECNEEDELRLLERFYYSPYLIAIPRDYYDRSLDTSEHIRNMIEIGLDKSRAISTNLHSSAPSLLLPPSNFGRRDLKKLVRRHMSGRASASDLKQFRATYFRNRTYFAGRSSLAFQPTQPGTDHGQAGLEGDASIAISHHYRAGCASPDGFHWDVYRENKDDLAKQIRFDCRQAGEKWPDGSHANLLSDDCLL